MASPIKEINPPGPGLLAQSVAHPPEKTTRTYATEPKNAKLQPAGDSVTLSISAKARKLKDEGESAVEIAKKLNLDVKTVNLYLGIAPAPAATLAQQMKQHGDSVVEIATRLNVDTKTVNLYLGIAPAPAATVAQQMKQQGESVVEIASGLAVDVKTVNRYLGISDAQGGTTKGTCPDDKTG